MAVNDLDHVCIAEMARFYRTHLLRDVMPFWEQRTKDAECGGYLTCFDRIGNVTDTDKYIWFQGRQLYMFSALYNRVEKRPEWLKLARWGRDFLVAHAHAGGGRWHYQLDRQGRVKRSTISMYTDEFVLGGLCEYAVASGSDDDHALIRLTYDTAERNVHDPNCKDIFHMTWSPRFKRHGMYMLSLATAALAEPLLGAERTKPLRDHCLENLLRVFAKDEHQALIESVGRDGRFIDEPEGRVLNPGHALESMWFCIHEGRARRDKEVVQRALQVLDWMYRRGVDPEFGGIVSFVDISGKPPSQMDWHKETGMLWHDKSWWANAETLVALACATAETGSQEWLDRFLAQHEWCQKHFYDPEYGEWYPELYRDGRPKLTDKGTPWKAAYHLPRALMTVMEEFDMLASSQSPQKRS